MIEELEKLYTAKEAMKYLRVSRSTFQRLLLAGKLSGDKVGHCWRFTLEQLKAAARAGVAAVLPADSQ